MKNIIHGLLLITSLFSGICQAISPDVFNLSLFPENVTEDELQQYLEDFISNPLDWEQCKSADIARLPLAEDILERLIDLKKTLPGPENWQDFQTAGQFNRAEIQAIQLFFTLPVSQLQQRVHVQHYTSVKNGTPPDLYRQLIRGKTDAGSGLSVGFVAERDPDERNLWDYANITVTARAFDDKLVMGGFSYKINWGHGLLFARNNLAFKSTSVSGNLLCGEPRFGDYTGTDENRYLQGAYLYHHKKSVAYFAGFSIHRLDATVQDSLVRTFRETGLHVTESELAAEDTLVEKMAFSGVAYKREHIQTGGIVFRSGYSYPVAAFGNRARQGGCSVYQQLDFDRWHLSGEIAMLSSHEYAVVHGIVFKPDDYSIGLQYRYFSDYFTARLAAPLKEYSGCPGNERGLLLGFQWKMNRLNRISGYVDYFSENRSFDEGNAPDFGNEAVIQWYHRGLNKQLLNLRLKRKINGINNVKYQLSGSARYILALNLTIALRVALNQVADHLGSGFGLAVNTGIAPSVDLTVGTTQFYVPIYESRVYLYEPGIPMRFNLFSLYGTGYRYFIVFEKDFGNYISASVSYKYQFRRLISESRQAETFLLEFQMLVDL